MECVVFMRVLRSTKICVCVCFNAGPGGKIPTSSKKLRLSPSNQMLHTCCLIEGINLESVTAQEGRNFGGVIKTLQSSPVLSCLHIKRLPDRQEFNPVGRS